MAGLQTTSGWTMHREMTYVMPVVAYVDSAVVANGLPRRSCNQVLIEDSRHNHSEISKSKYFPVLPAHNISHSLHFKPI